MLLNSVYALTNFASHFRGRGDYALIASCALFTGSTNCLQAALTLLPTANMSVPGTQLILLALQFFTSVTDSVMGRLSDLFFFFLSIYSSVPPVSVSLANFPGLFVILLPAGFQIASSANGVVQQTTGTQIAFCRLLRPKETRQSDFSRSAASPAS